MKGVLLIAIGNPSYAEMAKTLAISLKIADPSVKIALAHNFENLNPGNWFDNLIDVPEEAYNTNGRKEYIKVKTWMYELSPWTETIFLDVDMIWLFKKPISELFTKLAGLPFTIANTGKAGRSVWCDLEEAQEKYPGVEFWNYHSEFVYFEKCEKAQEYFDTVKDIYLNHGLKKTTNFGGASCADELAFQLASMKTGMYPHQETWNPTYWWNRDKKTMHIPPFKLSEEYYSYSIGGNKLPQTIKQNYSLVANYHYHHWNRNNPKKREFPYKPKDKRLFIADRKNF